MDCRKGAHNAQNENKKHGGQTILEPSINESTGMLYLPVCDLQEKLTAEEMNIVQRALKSDSSLRASKPKIKYHKVGKDKYGLDIYEPDYYEGCGAYVWRMLVFQISSKPQHQCMPVMAFADVPRYTPDGRKMSDEEHEGLRKKLDALTDKVLDILYESKRKSVEPKLAQLFDEQVSQLPAEQQKLLIPYREEFIRYMAKKVALGQFRGLIRWGEALGYIQKGIL